MKLQNAFLAIVIAVLSIFTVSCSTDNQSFWLKSAEKPVAKASLKKTKEAPKKPLSAAKKTNPAPTEVVVAPVDLVPMDSVPLVANEDFGVLPPIELDAPKTPDKIPDDADSVSSALQAKMLEVEDQNKKLKADLALASKQRKEHEEHAAAELQKKEDERLAIQKTTTLLLTIDHTETKDAVGDYSVGVYDVLGKDSQKLHRFVNLGTVISNQPGILFLKTLKGQIVSEYKLKKDINQPITIPDTIQGLGNVDKWHLTFKPETDSHSDTNIYFSLQSAKLKDNFDLLVSDTMMSWVLRSTPAPAPAPAPSPVANKESKDQANAGPYVGAGILAILFIILFFILSKRNKSDKLSQVEHVSDDKKVAAPSNVVDMVTSTPSPFTVADSPVEEIPEITERIKKFGEIPGPRNGPMTKKHQSGNKPRLRERGRW